MRWRHLRVSLIVLVCCTATLQAAGPSELLRQIKAVGPRGEVNVDAQAAGRELSQAEADVVLATPAIGEKALYIRGEHHLWKVGG